MPQGKTVKDQLGVDLEAPTSPQAVAPPEPTSDRPEWLPDNFKSPEDLARSYSEAQNRIREEAEARKSLETRLEQLTKVVEQFGENQNTPPPQQQADPRENLMAVFENDPIGTIAYLADQVATAKMTEYRQSWEQENTPQMTAAQQAQSEMMAMYVDNSLAERIPDWSEYREKVGEVLNQDSSLIPQSALASPAAVVTAIERVYKLVKADEIIAGNQQSGGGFVSTQMKERAQTMVGGGGRQQAVDPADAKLAELKAASKDISYSAWRS